VVQPIGDWHVGVKLKLMKIFVTGVAGFIGSHLAEALVQLGHSVIGVDCLTNYYSRALKLLNLAQVEASGVTVKRLDLVDEDLTPLLQDVDYIFHLAAQPGISASTPFSDYERNNILATHRLLEAAKKARQLRGFINVATSSVYGADATKDETFEPKPTSYYGVSKLAAEQLVLASARDGGFPACSLRLFSVYGPRERPEKLYPKLIHAILANQPFPLHEGSEKHLRSYTYIDDIIRGFVAVLNRFESCNGEIFNIGTDTAITTGEAIAIVEEMMGKKAMIDVKPKRPGDQLKTHTNIGKAKRLIAYRPTISPREGLERTVHWYKTHVFGKIDLY
jgi:UDP-glucuronate 4-epimerase